MANEKVIHVPRNYGISYNNGNNNAVLTVDAEYSCLLKNEEDPIYFTVCSVEEADGEAYIIPKTILVPGDTNVINQNISEIKCSDIVELNRIRSIYRRTKRSHQKYMEYAPADVEVFTFAFDNEKYPSKYRISVCKEEFIGLAIRDNNGNRRTVYGHINAINGDKVIFCRYLSVHGVRSIKPNYEIAISNLIGVYRYALDIQNYDEYQKELAEANTEKESVAE